MKFNNHSALESRTFQYKNPHLEFFCPLCGTKRAVVTNPHLSAKNYLQISLITIFLTALFFSVMQWKGLFLFFAVWASFEGVLRMNFRKEVPCPHCGFDASWYKKDVKVARQKVEAFWRSSGAEVIAQEDLSANVDDQVVGNLAAEGNEFEQFSDRAFN